MTKAPVFYRFPAAATPVAPFSHAVEWDGWIQLTGQMPTDPNNDAAALADGVEAQTRQVMDNLTIVLRELHLGLHHVLSCRVYLAEFKRDYTLMNWVYESYFEADRLTARTCTGVTGLARDALVEIDMVARRF